MREENLALLRRLVQAPLPPLPAPEPGSPRVIPEESRSGLPTARVVAERSRYLHSRYDPRREAQRLAASREGYLVLLGFGLGYLAAALGELPGVTGVLAVEPAPQVASLLREGVSLDHLCEVSPKVRLRFLEEPRRLGEELFSFYLPMLDGRITLLIAEGYEELVDLAPFRDAFNDGVARLAGNYRTMARLGRGWTTNIIRNCRRLAEGASDRFGLAAPPARPAGRLILAGAGPSLATFLGEADSRGWPSHGPGEGETLLLAADTALPILRSHGIRADLVLSIDAQSATYLHYLPAPGPQPRMILADLTAPVSLAGESLPLALFAGGHPLGAMLLRREEGVLPLSTEGGNVGYTLLSAADALGGREVSCYGLDYAYLSGAPYARGSYLDSYFLTRTDRVEPLCSLWTQLLWRDPEARRIEDAPPWSYTDPRLDRFRERFRILKKQLQARGVRFHRPIRRGVTPAEGVTPAGGEDGKRPAALPRIVSPRGLTESLEELKTALATEVDPAARPPWLLSPVERALLPLAAWVVEHSDRGEGGWSLEEAARVTDTLLEGRTPA